MLRHSVMGSDLSYEDMMDDRKLTEIYSATVSGDETLNGRQTYVVELTDKLDNAAYFKQRRCGLTGNIYSAKRGALWQKRSIIEKC